MTTAERVKEHVECVAKANGRIVDSLWLTETTKEGVIYDVYLEVDNVNSEDFSYRIYGVDYDGETLEFESGFLKHDEVSLAFARY